MITANEKIYEVTVQFSGPRWLGWTMPMACPGCNDAVLHRHTVNARGSCEKEVVDRLVGSLLGKLPIEAVDVLNVNTIGSTYTRSTQ